MLTAPGSSRVGSRTRNPALSRVDDVDRGALADFHDRYGTPALGPVVLVIAAYDEADALPDVLQTLPTTVCGLSTDVVVVDDGSQDGTAAAVQGAGRAYVVACAANRGQGAALRLGYRVARLHGAAYIVTTDADGQYDPADIPKVLGPVVSGTADFVSGSRRLGDHHSDDRVRRAGTVLFAGLVSVLVRRRLTDTSFGLRAMRAELTAGVTLDQPQYQSAELLIGAHMRGYRIAEVPGTMSVRSAGATKKGGNLPYALRYAGVVVGTWWREVRLGPEGRRGATRTGQAADAAPSPPLDR